MLNELISFFGTDKVQDALKAAIKDNKELSCNYNGLKVRITPNNGNLTIAVDYPAQQESAQFKDFCQQLPDEIFQGACELLGNQKIKVINLHLESGDVDKVRTGIVAFKNAVREYLINTINKYNDILKTV